MALFPAGASFLVYYPQNPATFSSFMLGTAVSWAAAAREGNITRLFPGFPTAAPSIPPGTPPPYPAAGNLGIPGPTITNHLPVSPIPVGYANWGLRRLPFNILVSAVGTASPWLEIGDMVSIDPPMEKTGSAQTTVLKSYQRAREFIPGFTDGDTVKCKARHSHRLFDFLHKPLGVNAAGTPLPDLVDATGLPGPAGGLRLLTTLFCILFPPNFGQGELSFGSQIIFAGFLADKGQPSFQSEDDKVIDLDFSIKVTGPIGCYSGA